MRCAGRAIQQDANLTVLEKGECEIGLAIVVEVAGDDLKPLMANMNVLRSLKGAAAAVEEHGDAASAESD
jgi:hypothetical protein